MDIFADCNHGSDIGRYFAAARLDFAVLENDEAGAEGRIREVVALDPEIEVRERGQQHTCGRASSKGMSCLKKGPEPHSWAERVSMTVTLAPGCSNSRPLKNRPCTRS